MSFVDDVGGHFRLRYRWAGVFVPAESECCLAMVKRLRCSGYCNGRVAAACIEVVFRERDERWIF